MHQCHEKSKLCLWNIIQMRSPIVCVLQDITAALEIFFPRYNAIWQRDRDEELKDFLVQRTSHL